MDLSRSCDMLDNVDVPPHVNSFVLKFLKSGSPRKSIEQLVKKFYNSVDPHVLSYSPSLPQFAA